MKKALLLLLLGGLLALVWYSTHASLDPALLRQAKKEYGAQQAKLANTRFITIIDFRKSICQKRLFVYDVKSQSVVLSTRVAHAFRSGLLYPTKFSNEEGSELSCYGTFLTDKVPYTGRFGRALRVDGITAGVNTNARSRAIVFHADPGFYNFSLACFMTSKAVNERLIAMIKGRSLVVVYK
ncbi:murein L,D-transpeptidase catalytic domain-containing protein [Hymenobacter nivis]|uniref:L,D-transpeptidase n=1 Tax=Hymenobacter nivis TaxID=1850093 RepID=A0A2Z3GLP9_9BACT|nr:murein L,D-transpeptidase catalytic domain family protein [Hymenobacter nivis]AWM32106.1 hypothetical protein DDQ68_04425 [Hymenobacter nivis]